MPLLIPKIGVGEASASAGKACPYRRHGVEKFELDFDPEHTTPARVFRASLPWRAMVVCPENDRNLARMFLPRGPYIFTFRIQTLPLH